MKTPLLVLSTDWHLKKSNLEEIKKLVFDQCQLALKLHLNQIYCLGDVFDSRISQRVEILAGFLEILEVCREYKIYLYCIPGNHDKTDYQSEMSFLAPFRNHPNLNLIENYRYFPTIDDDCMVHMIPYFDENKCYKNFLNLTELGDSKNVLLSHIAITGSRNNDGSLQENELNPEVFDQFDAIFLGHYHNYQTIGNVVHIPSIKQHNYGENPNKGYTIVYNDLSYKILHSNFKKYTKHVINVEEVTVKEIYQQIDNLKDSDDHNQVVFVGDRNKIKKLELSQFNSTGINIKFESSVITTSQQEYVSDATQFTANDIEKSFIAFCSEFNYDHTLGISYLQEAVRQNSLLSTNEFQ